MVKDDEGWIPPQHKPVTREALDRAIIAEEEAASQDHQAREAWFDGQHSTVMLKLTDGRVFGAEPGFIGGGPSRAGRPIAAVVGPGGTGWRARDTPARRRAARGVGRN